MIKGSFGKSLARLMAGRMPVLGAAALLVLCCAGGSAQHKQAAGRVARIEIDKVRVEIPDLALLDQDGRKVRFYSDLLKDKVVVMSFFYTSCEYLCSMQGEVFSKLQALLGERAGKSVFLVSVTLDPATDTPERLKAWGARYGVKPGWTLVTGEEPEMNKLLVKMTGSSAGRNMHSSVTIIGNDRRGAWVGADGVGAPEDLLKIIDEVEKRP